MLHAMDTAPSPEPRPEAASRMLLRGLGRRCPLCGGGGLFEGWLRARPSCPSCGLKLDRGEPDFWSGAWMLNIVGVETVFALLLAAGVVLLWPAVPWAAVLWVGIAGMLLMPLLFFPISRTLWLAIDLAFRPPVPPDFVRERAGP